MSTQPNLTLTGIVTSLIELYAYREEIARDKDMVPAEQLETLKLIDNQIDDFVRLELDKADGIGYQWNEFGMRAATCAADADAARKRAGIWALRADDLADRTLKAMQLRQTKKIEGARYTLAIKKNPASVQITDPAEIPKPYMRRTVTMNADLYDRLMAHLMTSERGAPIFQELMEAKASDPEPMKAEIGKELKAKVEVPGAKLIDDRVRLEIS